MTSAVDTTRLGELSSSNYQHLGYSRDELMDAMRDGYAALIDFVSTRQFQAILEETNGLAATERPAFVVRVLLSREALEARGIAVPPDIMIQRSAFGDRRPTLFAVKKWLPERFKDVWENVNLTFDNEYIDSTVSRDADIAWRTPLPIAGQAEMMAGGQPLESNSK